ncbi:hypothetical protein SFR_2530 [Streptomyces sp. FR-008]|nr:hypothetical protein SFR_2530 [Streptomyces sp. FR-008]
MSPRAARLPDLPERAALPFAQVVRARHVGAAPG